MIKIQVPAIPVPLATFDGEISVGVSLFSTLTVNPSLESLADTVNKDITSVTEFVLSLTHTVILTIRIMEPA
jgi:hypothetical protein